MPEIFDLVFVEDIGKDKPRYQNVGIFMIKDDGKKSVKMNCIPVGNWNGWLSIFPKRDKNDRPVQSSVPEGVTDIEPF